MKWHRVGILSSHRLLTFHNCDQIFVLTSWNGLLLFQLGHVPSGLRVHPDMEHLIYPLGCTVILKRIADGDQEFLHGHTNNVSCISVSKSGSFIASGQVNFMGFKVGKTSDFPYL